MASTFSNKVLAESPLGGGALASWDPWISAPPPPPLCTPLNKKGHTHMNHTPCEREQWRQVCWERGC